MKKRIINSEIPILIEDIEKFEKDNDIIFPENLKNLYLKYNGGEIEISDSNFYSQNHISGKKAILIIIPPKTLPLWTSG